MMMQFDIYNNASLGMQGLIEAFPDFTRKAIKASGFWAMQQVQQGIASGAPGGQSYADFYPQPLRKSLDQVLTAAKYSNGRGRGKNNYPPMGRLKQAVKYRYMNNSARGMAVAVGWLSKSSQFLGAKQQEGYQRPVTDAVRRAFDASYAKLGLEMRLRKSTKTLQIPARQTMGPMQRVVEAGVGPLFESKFRKAMTEAMK